jgi:hypothetical protein
VMVFKEPTAEQRPISASIARSCGLIDCSKPAIGGGS